jgi:hypothetical protein
MTELGNSAVGGVQHETLSLHCCHLGRRLDRGRGKGSQAGPEGSRQSDLRADLFQIDRQVMTTLIELGAPHFVRTLVLARTEAD